MVRGTKRQLKKKNYGKVSRWGRKIIFVKAGGDNKVITSRNFGIKTSKGTPKAKKKTIKFW